MKKNKEEVKKRRQFDKGRTFVKITAGILALLMIITTGVSLIFALI